MGPVRRLNRYYRENPGFREWIRVNEAWLRENPDVFGQLLKNPNMMNMFLDLMVLNSSRVQRRLGRGKRRK